MIKLVKKKKVPKAAHKAVAVLNRALEADPEAVNSVIQHRVSCNGTLALDESIQVGQRSAEYTLSALGLINGIVGVGDDGWGFVAAVIALECVEHGPQPGKDHSRCPVDDCPRTLSRGKIHHFEVLDRSL